MDSILSRNEPSEKPGTIQVILGVAIVGGIGLLLTVPVRAHHSFAAEFDASKPVKVEGTVVRVEWTNPHTWFHVDVKTLEGKTERWMFEGGSPGSLTRRGFAKDYIKPGTELVVEGFMSKAHPHRANGRVMTYADGRTLFVGSSGTGAPTDGRDPTER